MGWMAKIGASVVTWGAMAGMAAAAGAAVPAGQAEQVFKVPALEQPAGVPLEFVRTKSMEAGLAIQPVAIDLGEWTGLKSAPEMPVHIIGASRAVQQAQSAAQTAQLLQWQPSAKGGTVAALSVRSGGAQGLRLGLVVEQLPGSAMLRLYTDHQPAAVFEIAGQRVMQTLQANRDAGDHSEAGRTWWTPSSSGEQVSLEIELPPGTAPDQLKVSLPQVMHIYENLSLPLGTEESDAAQEDAKAMPLGNPVECHLDVNCFSQLETERKGVARMAYVTERMADGSYYYGLCTGSLLNDAQGSRTPYFLTAAHCMSTQTLASALETDWFYTSTRCSSNSLSPSSVNLRNGAQLLYSSANPDVTLLKLNDTPPAGAVFLGWDSSIVPNSTSVAGVHHPDGGLQKISFGTMSSRYDCSLDSKSVFCTSAPSSGNYYYVQWTLGLTQPGSSGSPLFNNGAVTGVLTGASEASCRANAGGAYSFYPSLNSVMPALRKWLVDAGGTQTPVAGRMPVYRFYNTQNGTHFFTASAQERDAVIQGNPNYQYENIGFYASTQTAAAPNAVYRFYNNNSGSHFYTINADERAFVIANYPQFSVEGTAWYARQAQGEGSVPMYRFYNTLTGAHFYTTNPSERDFVVATYPQFNFEGVGYYVWGSQ